MKVLLATAGGFGDTSPFIPLGLAIERAGHQVSVLAPHDMAERFTAFGLPPTTYAFGDAEANDPALMEAWLSTDAAAHNRVLATWAAQLVTAAAPALAEQLAACDVAIVGPLLMTPATEAAKDIPRPMAWLQHTPGIPTMRGDSVFGAPDSRVRVANLVAGLRAGLDSMAALGPGAQVMAGHLGRRPMSRLELNLRMSRTPMFTAVSPLVAPAFARSTRTPTTGYLFLPPTTPLSKRTEAFLDAGDPPVHVGLGTVSRPAARERVEVLLDAAVAAGRRVIAPRSLGLDEGRYPAGAALFTDFEPYDKLFPRCAMVVHQGGAGTQALAFAADVPQFATPLTIDQAYFGRRGHELGVSPVPVHLQAVTGADLRNALSFADRPRTRRRVADVGAHIRSEDGTGNALRFLGRVLPGLVTESGA